MLVNIVTGVRNVKVILSTFKFKHASNSNYFLQNLQLHKVLFKLEMIEVNKKNSLRTHRNTNTNKLYHIYFIL